mmetsp:Transcript_23429/g.54558  ORF Transcript_23429/g.54558 Transcript_23429/m.54558 type:complete len:736 (+) Transcript_23429:88-2295(+)
MDNRFAIHRSGAHAQIQVDAQDAKVQQLLRRGRKEGFASKFDCPLKPLGAPMGGDEISAMTTQQLSKVERMKLRVVQNVGAQQDPKSAKHQEAESSMLDYLFAGDKQDGDGVDKSQGARLQQRDNAAAKDALQPFSRDQDAGGISTLRRSIRDSEFRMQLVKSFAPGTAYGLDYSTAFTSEHLLPPRKNYPPNVKHHHLEDGSSSARLSGEMGSLSARLPAPPQQVQTPQTVGSSPLPPEEPRQPKSARAMRAGDLRPQSLPRAVILNPMLRLPAGSRWSQEVKPRLAPRNANQHQLEPSRARQMELQQEAKLALAATACAEMAVAESADSPLKKPKSELAATKNSRQKSTRVEAPSPPRREVYFSPVDAKMRPRPLPIRLPSLADFIAKTEPTVDGRANRDSEGSQLRELIDELLGLKPEDRGRTLKISQEELMGPRRGRWDFRRKIEKQLDMAWQDRVAYKRFTTANPGNNDEGKGTDTEWNPAGAADPSNDPEAGNAGYEAGRRRRTWTEEEEAVAYSKVVSMLQETDSSVDPVSRLKSTLKAYQASRDTQRGQLMNALHSMEVDRLRALHRRAQYFQPRCDGPVSNALAACALMRIEGEKDMLNRLLDAGMQKQYLWYRDLWYHVQSEKRDLSMSNVAFFIFDFVKEVLEHGVSFSKDMLFLMLSQIDNSEFTALIASLIVFMAKSLGVSSEELLQWFKTNRGATPTEIESALGNKLEADSQPPEVLAGLQ